MLKDYSNEFLILKKYIYLDHAAVSPIPQRSVQAGYNFLNELSHESHTHFESWIEKIHHVKSTLANLLHCDQDEVTFIKNTSEGLLKVANGIDWKKGDNIVLFSNEFPSNVYPWQSLENRGVEIRFVPENEGAFHIEDIEQCIDHKTRLLSVSFVEFSTGYKNNLIEIGKLCHKRNIIFVVDAIQGLGAIPINVKDCHIDFLSSGGHKWLMSGMGIGCFYANLSSIDKLSHYIYGHGAVDSHIDFLNYKLSPRNTAQRFDDGLFNIAGIYTMDASLNLLLEVGIENIYNHIKGVTDYLISNLYAKGYKILSPAQIDSRSGIISFYSDIHKSDDIFKLLKKNNIIISNRRNAIRVSTHFYNTNKDIDQLLSILPDGS